MGACCGRKNARVGVQSLDANEATSVAPTASFKAGAAGSSASIEADGGAITASSSVATGGGNSVEKLIQKTQSQAKGAQGKPWPKRPMGCKLSQACWDKLEELFGKMDPDGSNAVSREEARAFFKGAFGKISADAMFNEVDVDGSGAIDSDEFVSFWVHVRKNGYKEQDIMDELDELCEGGTWVDWKDGKDTGTANVLTWPKKPLLCRLSQAAWNKCQELFEKIDACGGEKTGVLTQEKANKHFQGGKLSKVSTEAMFNEIDEKQHGQITPKEWMKFWVQVKSSGYKSQDIIDELENLMEGQQWVDWKDGRTT